MMKIFGLFLPERRDVNVDMKNQAMAIKINGMQAATNRQFLALILVIKYILYGK